MTGKEIAKIQEDVNCEGFFNAFFHYDDYLWVEDALFHQLLSNLHEAANKLAEYTGTNPNT